MWTILLIPALSHAGRRTGAGALQRWRLARSVSACELRGAMLGCSCMLRGAMLVCPGMWRGVMLVCDYSLICENAWKHHLSLRISGPGLRASAIVSDVASQTLGKECKAFLFLGLNIVGPDFQGKGRDRSRRVVVAEFEFMESLWRSERLCSPAALRRLGKGYSAVLVRYLSQVFMFLF